LTTTAITTSSTEGSKVENNNNELKSENNTHTKETQKSDPKKDKKLENSPSLSSSSAVNGKEEITEKITNGNETTSHNKETQPQNQQSQEEEVSLISKYFDGKWKRTRTCPQKHTFYSSEIFRTLPLQFPPDCISTISSKKKNKKKLTLEEMLQSVTTEEKISCRCEQCGGTEDKVFKLKTEIDQFPFYLVIQLGRFVSTVQNERWWSNKINTEVFFPLEMDMNKIYTSSPTNGEKPIYELFAVANHKGLTNGGHYWIFSKFDDGEWFNINDNHVKPIMEKDIQTSFAYMLFYRKKKPK